MNRRLDALVLVLVVVLAGVAYWTGYIRFGSPASVREQACGLPAGELERIQRGYFGPRSGQISILPRQPAYMASGAGGWSHSGPWPYLQDIPLVFYAPGIITGGQSVDRPVTLADVAPTLATLLKGSIRSDDGRSLEEVRRLDAEALVEPRPRLIVVVVWDGGGWNVLRHWEDSWPNLQRMMDDGVTYTKATVGSSPSVTPAVHTTLGTGVFPHRHGVTGVPVRDEEGEVVDSFLKGESSHFIQVAALAERWDEQNANRPKIGMVGYEPWHLGMIGQGAERSTGDHDDAAWLDVDTNEWITNPKHYRLPAALPATPGLEEDLNALDERDGSLDRAWGEHAILDDPSRIEETPAFIAYHERALEELIAKEGYGRDDVTDLLFTNFKQIDRVGHYFNIAADEVRQSLEETDTQLGRLEDALDREVGVGEWVLVVTADHGQQPDEDAIDGYGINPKDLDRDIDAAFGGDVSRAVWPTEIFLDEAEMSERGVSVDDVARYVSDYRLADNARGPRERLLGAGTFSPRDRLFDLAIPAATLPDLSC